MTSRWASIVATAALFVAAAVAAQAAEMYAIVAHGQSIQGSAPPGKAVRIQFPLAAGSEPRLTLTFLGSQPNRPISFTEATLIGPDGQPVNLPTGQQFFVEKHRSGRDTISLRGWVTQVSGTHEFLLETNSNVLTRVKGKLDIVRPRKLKLVGDEGAPPIQLALLPGDKSRVSVKRVSGTAPRVASYRIPSGAMSTPGQKLTKKGSTAHTMLAIQFGVHEYTVGYQGEPAAGQWKATIRITPFRGGFPATLQLRNSPGIPVSVLDVDRFVVPSLGPTRVGVATDGAHVVVTGEQNGVVNAQAYDFELQPSIVLPNVVAVTGLTDLSPGETLDGHRLTFAGSRYLLAFSSASGAEVNLVRFRPDFVREGYQQVVTGSASPANDFFLVANTSRVAVGLPAPPDGHSVALFDIADFGNPAVVAIGGPTRPQRPGSGAAWRADDEVFELWSPSTLDYRGPSDLHRVLFDANWAATTADARPVADLVAVETMPTGVVVDPPSQVTIVHYVVADNPPLDPNLPGSGRIHRRLFDATGVEVPGSHAVLPRASCNRPVCTILGRNLYLAYETPNGPIVERFPILR